MSVARHLENDAEVCEPRDSYENIPAFPARPKERLKMRVIASRYSFYGTDRHRTALSSRFGTLWTAVHKITSGITAVQPTGATLWMPFRLSHLTRAYAELGQFDDAWRCIDEALTAMETTKEKWSEAEVHRTAGEIALKLPEPDAVRSEAYFERALTVARQQQAKSWELRASMSLARLWHDHGKAQQARELLAPVYEWFTEGFDTRDLMEAKALLQELAA